LETGTKREREKQQLRLESELKMVNDTIDKLNAKRVVILTKIHQLKKWKQ
jgi:hypothetical protein